MLVQHMLAEARKRLATISVDAPLAEAARLLSYEHLNLVAVCNQDGKLIGVISDSDIVHCVSACHPECRRACTLGAEAAMTREVIACTLEDSLREVWAKMKDHDLRHLPVLDEAGGPIGILFARDVLRVLLEEAQIEEQDLKDYFLGLGYH
ncbi:CBS domain-containing protein [Inquilinus sp. OTU3971]|uniref:CBS domain-containing protein n=1 Tax=Inquilinus sp. OTU3971 TaxID=3043855 RepID=UPI00313E1178